MTITPELEASPELIAMARAMVNSKAAGDIWETMRPVSREWFIDMAKAALLALQEPTEGMVEAGFDLPDFPERHNLAVAFTAMINHVLGERS